MGGEVSGKKEYHDGDQVSQLEAVGLVAAQDSHMVTGKFKMRWFGDFVQFRMRFVTLKLVEDGQRSGQVHVCMRVARGDKGVADDSRCLGAVGFSHAQHGI